MSVFSVEEQEGGSKVSLAGISGLEPAVTHNDPL